MRLPFPVTSCYMLVLLHASEAMGPEPIDIPDDTPLTTWAAEPEGVYLGTCYHFSNPPNHPTAVKTTQNVSIAIGPFDLIILFEVLTYKLQEDDFYFFSPAAI